MKKLKIRDVLWLIYELLIFPGYGILCWVVALGYIPNNYLFEFLIITGLFAIPKLIMGGVFGSKPKHHLENILKLTI